MKHEVQSEPGLGQPVYLLYDPRPFRVNTYITQHTTFGENMMKGAALVKTLIENSDRVQSYDFSYLNSSPDQMVGKSAPKKLSGSKMTAKVKQPTEKRAHYTFAL